MKNDYEKVRSSRNELEAILRIRGISKQRFGRILNIMQRLSQFLNVGVKDTVDIIEIDLKDEIIIVEGEDNFSVVESLSTNRHE